MWLADVWGVTMIGHVGLNCIYPCVQKFKHPIQSTFFLNLLTQITRKLSSSIPFSSTLLSKNQKTFFLSLFQMCVFPLNALYPFFPTPFSSSVFMSFLLSLFVVYLLSLLLSTVFRVIEGTGNSLLPSIICRGLTATHIRLKTHWLQTGEQAVTGSLNCASHTNKHEKNMSHWCILNLHYVSFMPKSLSCVAPQVA